ncbi:hypothetical protein LZ554_009189 [Drepanopeziza brunnea f. sp. 'monogermtubi']|nr:hypothetical protein LZ554_009189 [Drepanopeziza brunnea f. sp. 'monogermtubi']
MATVSGFWDLLFPVGMPLTSFNDDPGREFDASLSMWERVPAEALETSDTTVFNNAWDLRCASWTGLEGSPALEDQA